MVSKRYISPDELQKYSFELGMKILRDGFKPTWIIALWRGGCPVGMYIQGLFKHYGCNADHISVRTSSYNTEGEQHSDIRVHGLEYVIKNMKSTDSVLLIDDVFDSGRSIKAVVTKMERKLRNNFPSDLRVATVFYKPQNNKTTIVPNYFYEITTDWLVFGHEFEDLTKEEIKEFMGFDMPVY